MAQRRMFSPAIVKSEEFLSMPMSSQLLYFHLGMDADDDGFIQPKIIMRVIGAAEDDLKVLLAKRFILSFESGVIVIKHWLIHNLIQKDRYHQTRFQDEKKRLFIKENKAYTENQESVNKMLPQVRLGKDRLSVPEEASGTLSSEDSEEDDSSIEATDEEGNPRAKPKVKNPAHAGARRVQSYFGRKASEYTHKQVIVHGYTHIRKLIEDKKITEQNLVKVIDAFFEEVPSDERATNIYVALSIQNINKFIAQS